MWSYRRRHHCCLLHAACLLHFFRSLYSLLAYVWRGRQFDSEDAVSTERRCSAYHRSKTTRTHHASATPVALASSPSTSAVQTGLYHVQVTIWSGPPVPGPWCPATCWQRSASTSISQLRTQKSFGDRVFSVAGPKIWNDLPLELRHVDISFGQFRNMLKSYLFRFYSATAHRDFLIIAP